MELLGIAKHVGEVHDASRYVNYLDEAKVHCLSKWLPKYMCRFTNGE